MQKIKDWKEEDRPRERLSIYGGESLSDAELLGILINNGYHERSALDLANELLVKSGNSLIRLAQLSLEELMQIKGIGKAKASCIKALFEIAGRFSAEIPAKEIQIISCETILKIIGPRIRNIDHEECWVFFLNRANRLIFKERISSGGTAATIMDTKIIIKKAVDKLASSIILLHNHPSGNPYPSEQDRKSTSLLKEACSYLDISLLDHIIIARDRHYSFSDEGIL